MSALPFGSRTRTIARREFLATVRRKGFFFTMVILPAWSGFAFSMSHWADRLGSQPGSGPQPIGVVDSSGVFALAPGEVDTIAREQGSRRFDIRSYPSLEAARAAFERHQVSAFLVVSRDYLQSGRLSEYRRSGGLFSRAAGSVPWRSWMRGRLVEGKLGPEIVARVREPGEPMGYVPDEKGGFKIFRPEDALGSVFVPMGFGMLLFASIFTASGYLLQGMAEEKESRILETLLSSVTADELMAGKLLGLGGAGLLLGVVWSALGLQVLTAMAPVFLPSPQVLAALVVYFVLGYFFVGALALGLGSLVNSYQEATTISAMLSLLVVVPWLLSLALIEDPGSPFARVLSWIPPASPVTMSMRLSQGPVPAWEIGLSLGLLALSGYLMFLLWARVFRVALLLYGKTWNLPEIVRWMRA